MSDSERQRDFAHSGFFVLRTPLLPFDELLAWSEGMEAADAIADTARLQQALERDRLRLRQRLSDMISRPEIQEAIFVASPDLHESLQTWMHDPESERGQRVERALVRYFARMTGRATPFGLFAGVSIGDINKETHLELEPRESYRRHTRLDMDYLYALKETLANDRSLQKSFLYKPNSSLYRAGDRLRLIETRLQDEVRTFHLIAVEEDEYLSRVLERSKNGARFETLVSEVMENEIDRTEAEEYVGELVSSQIIVPEIPLPVTGEEPTHPLIKQLREQPETREVADKLEKCSVELSKIDAAGLGVSTDCYRTVAGILESLPAKVQLSRLFQVDMVKPVTRASLSETVIQDILSGVRILHEIAPPAAEGSLKRFREAFQQRYESQEVPLVEALDEEIGVGFETGREPSPLLRGLAIASAKDEMVITDPRQKFLLRKLTEALQSGSQEIVLREEDLEKMRNKDPLPLPDAFAATITLGAHLETDLQEGKYDIVLSGAFGPSGARLIGRFCHAEESIHRCVKRHLEAEEALHPDAVFAEVVHLPEGRIGNILCRPLLRKYEIPYLGFSSTSPEYQIPVTDLLVSIRKGRIVLHSRQLGREVIPRMTNAHNYSLSTLGIYRFLCDIQQQGLAAFAGWSWGQLSDAPFLPRIRFGHLILSRAQWSIDKEELKRLVSKEGVKSFQAVQKWRSERHLPRWILLADYDNTLPVDLENVLSIETFLHLAKEREEIVVKEWFPGPEQLCVGGPEGRFVHEIVVPFVRTKADTALTESRYVLQRPTSSALRTFPPGSEWLYVKLYTGPATADLILCNTLADTIRQLLSSGEADRWFFIRYGDPDWHLRLRFHGAPDSLHTRVLPALQETAHVLLEKGLIRRFQVDTYEREVERYGGLEGTLLAEQIFYADSEAVLEMLELLEPGEGGMEECWKLAFLGIDRLLNDFGFELSRRLTVMKDVRDSFGKEFRVDSKTKQQLGARLRKERVALEALLQADHQDEHPLGPGYEILQQRSERQKPIITELKELEQAGKLSASLDELAKSYIHMFVNRLLRSAQREQELVLYDFLTKLYESKIARIP